MPCRLRFRYALTHKLALDLCVSNASTITVGGICELVYRHAKGIPSNCGIDIIGSKSHACISRAPRRFVWRPTNTHARRRLWPGIPIHGKRHIKLSKHCWRMRRS